MTLSKKNLTLAGLLILVSSTYLRSQTVYVNSPGVKYHNENCAQLGRNRSAIALTEAELKGYRFCNSCSLIKKEDLKERKKRKENENNNQTAAAEEKKDN